MNLTGNQGNYGTLNYLVRRVNVRYGTMVLNNEARYNKEALYKMKGKSSLILPPFNIVSI